MAIEKGFFSYREVAAMWGVSTFTVRRLVESGQLAAVNLGAQRRISRQELERAALHGCGTPRPRKAR